MFDSTEFFVLAGVIGDAGELDLDGFGICTDDCRRGKNLRPMMDLTLYDCLIDERFHKDSRDVYIYIYTLLKLEEILFPKNYRRCPCGKRTEERKNGKQFL